MTYPITVKQGATFDFTLTLPTTYPDGFFLGCTLQAQIRTPTRKLIADLTPTWAAPAATTRFLRLYNNATEQWTVGVQELDARMVLSSGEKFAIETQLVEILRSVTQV